MTRSELSRFLGPTGWFVIVLIGAAIAIAVVQGIGFRFDPFNRAEGRADRAEAVAAAATSNAGARSAEAAGAVETTRAVEAAHRTTRAADAIVHRHERRAEAAPDAETLLDPDRAARLRRLDGELCELDPAVCADGPAQTDLAGGGDDALPAAPPSG